MKKTTQSNGVVLATLSVFYGLYLIVNHWPMDRIELPFMVYEEDIPFVPWTIVIYLSLFFQAVLFIKYIPEKIFWRVMLLGFVMLLIHIIIFCFFPVKYPRENYESDNLILELFRYIDTAGNCLPSLHVSCAIFFANLYVIWEKSMWRKVVMCIWSALIIVSVLTVKQHYIWDILLSIVITRLFIIIPFESKLRLRP